MDALAKQWERPQAAGRHRETGVSERGTRGPVQSATSTRGVDVQSLDRSEVSSVRTTSSSSTCKCSRGAGALLSSGMSGNLPL